MKKIIYIIEQKKWAFGHNLFFMHCPRIPCRY
nr:MAG TPA: hypothetical protein [Caudoviricetes sp.]